MNKIEVVSCLKPQGPFCVMMNMKSFIGKTMYGKVIHLDEAFAQLFLEKELVATVPCSSFDTSGYILPELRGLHGGYRQGPRPAGDIYQKRLRFSDASLK